MSVLILCNALVFAMEAQYRGLLLGEAKRSCLVSSPDGVDLVLLQVIHMCILEGSGQRVTAFPLGAQF